MESERNKNILQDQCDFPREDRVRYESKAKLWIPSP